MYKKHHRVSNKDEDIISNTKYREVKLRKMGKLVQLVQILPQLWWSALYSLPSLFLSLSEFPTHVQLWTCERETLGTDGPLSKHKVGRANIHNVSSSYSTLTEGPRLFQVYLFRVSATVLYVSSLLTYTCWRGHSEW